MEVPQIVKKVGKGISEHSPTILTYCVVGGVITTAIFTATAASKASEIIREECRNQKVEDLPRKEVFKLTWKYYIPAAGMGLVTAACAIGSNSVNHQRNEALAKVYNLTETALREYKDKVIETIGKNKELKVRDEISADRINSNPPGKNEVIFTGKGDVLCYDSLSGRYFKSDIEKIRQSINRINKEFLSEMWVSLNEVYYELGLSDTRLGDELGWDLEQGLLDISFSSQVTEDGEPCLVLNYDVKPRFMR